MIVVIQMNFKESSSEFYKKALKNNKQLKTLAFKNKYWIDTGGKLS